MTPILRRRRRGLSLVELLISMVVLGIIGIAMVSLLTSQTRFFSKMSLGRDARSVTRQTRNLLQTELSMVEVGAGVVAASPDSLTVRVPIAFGLYCGGATMMVLPTDSMYLASAVISGYAIKDTSIAGAYAYTALTSSGSGVSSNCTSAPVLITPPPGGSYINLAPPPSGVTASPMFLYQNVTYKFGPSTLVSGQRGLWRKAGTGAYAEIAAPFDTSARFRFYNLNTDTAQAAVPSPLSNMRGVQLRLDALSPTAVPGQAPRRESSSVTTAIFFRNRRDT